VGLTPSSNVMTSVDKEGKRTLTDFRIVGFGFVSEHTTWSWGTTRPIDEKAVFLPPSTEIDGPAANPSIDEVAPVKQEEADAAHEQVGNGQEKAKKAPKETARIRIYFQPAPGSVSRGVASTNQNMAPPNAVPLRASAKRKKSESEEDDGDRHNVKRHHGDHDETRPSLIVEMLTPDTNGADNSNVHDDAPTVDSNQFMSAETQRDTEQGSEVSNDVDWLGDALKEGDDLEQNGFVEENEYSQMNGGGQGSAEFLDELDEEDEEAASLFGSGVHPSPPNIDGNTATELIVQAVDDVDGEGNTQPDSQADASKSKLPVHPSGCATSTPAVGGQSSGAGGPGGAGNKLSISFSTSRRRLVLEVEVIEYLKVFRAEGRIEFVATLEQLTPVASEESKPNIKGVCVRPFI
jgi:20S proteasome subunit alpha 6